MLINLPSLRLDLASNSVNRFSTSVYISISVFCMSSGREVYSHYMTSALESLDTCNLTTAENPINGFYQHELTCDIHFYVHNHVLMLALITTLASFPGLPHFSLLPSVAHAGKFWERGYICTMAEIINCLSYDPHTEYQVAYGCLGHSISAMPQWTLFLRPKKWRLQSFKKKLSAAGMKLTTLPSQSRFQAQLTTWLHKPELEPNSGPQVGPQLDCINYAMYTLEHTATFPKQL